MNNNKSLSLNELLVLRNKYAEKVVKKFKNSIKLLNEYDNYINNNKYMMKGGGGDNDFPEIKSNLTIDDANRLAKVYTDTASKSEESLKVTLDNLDAFFKNESRKKEDTIKELKQKMKTHIDELARLNIEKNENTRRIQEAKAEGVIEGRDAGTTAERTRLAAEQERQMTDLVAKEKEYTNKIKSLEQSIAEDKDSHDALVIANQSCQENFRSAIKMINSATGKITNMIKTDTTPTS